MNKEQAEKEGVQRALGNKATFTYRIPIRKYEFIDVNADSFKDLMEAVKQVHQTLEKNTQHAFPTKRTEQDIPF